MAKLKEKLWNWGHLEGSHNKIVDFNCTMSPEEFAESYGIKNAFIVSYGGNITPPFSGLAERFSSLNQIKWSILGDASTPLPEEKLGNTNDVIEVAKDFKNITGGVVDDFFSPERTKRFTPEVLTEIKENLNKNGLDFWCVLYSHEFDLPLENYVDCFDGITFWIWKSEDIANMKDYFTRLKNLAKNIPVMLGVYLWDYGNGKAMDPKIFENQLAYYFELLKNKEIEGIVFCSNTIGDMPLETNKILKEYIKKYSDIEN
ncbi:MAG: hypothetical protein E7551_07560 [Ruminococcaceae bacterium]|nr:hypothetical protein [Oscillospiraceae bacterium]